MNANMQQWAGELAANTETIASVILTSDNSPSDLHLLSRLLINIASTSASMKRTIEEVLEK